ncbi:threonine/serine exporter ThrE [Corynebacterium xerosis]|uniref:Threonine/serine exporter family protein n=2 Tax=Corynebacterium xerosis TaxID=1725 RepID=A0A7X9XTV7_9CORY|nr:threonine/serine exporter family protein [Corynebacterium xerosis]
MSEEQPATTAATIPGFGGKLRAKVRNAMFGPQSTVDLVQSTRTPLPLAPIDYTDPDQVTAVLDLAAQLGGLLLSCGTGNSDTVLQLKAVTSAYGLTRVQVDITLTSVTVYHLIGARRTPVTAMRVVDAPSVDFDRLRRVDALLRSIRGGQISLEDAVERADAIEASPPLYRLRIIYLGWAAMAAAVSVLLGGGPSVAVVAAIVTAVIVAAIGELNVRALPPFFQNATGGFIATVAAAVAYELSGLTPFDMQPSRVIASGIIVMLAGLTLVQSLQDGMTGAPVTGSARFFDTMLLTGGIVAGIAIGFEVTAFIGIPLPPISVASDPNFAESTVRVLAGSVASVAFALASNAGWKALGVSGATALLGSMLYYWLLLPIGVNPVAAAGAAATAVGLAGGLLSRRTSIPPLVTAIAGVTPFLPGMSIYRGLHALLNGQPLNGFTALASALGTATALAAGIALGEWLARQMRRPPRLIRHGDVKRPKIQRRRRRHVAGTQSPDGSANPVEGRTRLSRSARAKFGRRYGRAPGDEGVDW